jgi:hypothetical protein
MSSQKEKISWIASFARSAKRREVSRSRFGFPPRLHLAANLLFRESRRVYRRCTFVSYEFYLDWSYVMSEKTSEDKNSPEKVAVTLPGTVEKIIPPIAPTLPEKAQITVEGAEHLYREIRVENTFQDADGNDVSLKKGATVEVTIAADPEATVPKK